MQSWPVFPVPGFQDVAVRDMRQKWLLICEKISNQWDARCYNVRMSGDEWNNEKVMLNEMTVLHFSWLTSCLQWTPTVVFPTCCSRPSSWMQTWIPVKLCHELSAISSRYVKLRQRWPTKHLTVALKAQMLKRNICCYFLCSGNL